MAEALSSFAIKRPLRLMFQDEARFGRISDCRYCWAKFPLRPTVKAMLTHQYVYAYGAVSIPQGSFDSLVLPQVNSDCMGLFLAEISDRYPEENIVMVLDGAGWHTSQSMPIPSNIRLISLPPYSPELNPVEHLWDELREKHFHNHAFDSLDALEEQLVTGLLALENNAQRVSSICNWDWIINVTSNANLNKLSLPMSPTAFALVILAALIHASWNIVAKKASGGALFVALNVWVTTVIYAPVFALYVYRYPPQLGWPELVLLVLSGALHLAYSLILQRGYQKHDLTIVYPVARGTGPLLSSVFAILVLGEKVTLYSALGIACIVVGIFVLAGGHRMLRARTAAQLSGVGYGAVTGLMIAAYALVDGYGVKYLLIAPMVLDYVCNVVRAIFLAPMAWQRRDELHAEWRKNRRYTLFIGIISPVSYVLVLYAMQTAPISSVAPMRELSMVFAAFLGAKLLGEGHRGERIFGAALMALGVWGLMHG